MFLRSALPPRLLKKLRLKGAAGFRRKGRQRLHGPAKVGIPEQRAVLCLLQHPQNQRCGKTEDGAQKPERSIPPGGKVGCLHN
jgi:hypothetical protein